MNQPNCISILTEFLVVFCSPMVSRSNAAHKATCLLQALELVETRLTPEARRDLKL
jgi:hypothetical protein